MDDHSPYNRPASQMNYGWLLGISGVLLLVLLPFSAYIVSLPFLQGEWDINNAQSGLVFSSYLIGYAISSLIIVPLTDRYSTRTVMLLGLSLLVIGNLLFPLLAHNLWTGATIRAITGAGHVAAYIPAIRLISQHFPGQSRGTAVGLFVSAGYAGTTLSYAVTGGLIASMSSWQQAYFAISLAGVVGLVLAWPLLYCFPFEEVAPAPTATVSNGIKVDETKVKKSKEPGRLDLTILRERAIALCTLSYALHTAELYLARLWFPLLLTATFAQTSMGLTQAAARAGTWSGFMFMTGIIGVFSGGYISDRVGRTAGAFAIFTASGLCSLTVGWLVSLPTLLIGVGFVYGLTTAADSAIYSTAIIELAPPDRVGSAQAVQSFVGFSIGAAAPILVGAILDTSDATWQWIAAFSTNGALALIGILALLSLRRMPEALAMADRKR